MAQSQGFFDRLRTRRSVLKRTTKRKELPAHVLYIEWLSGDGSRKLLGPDGAEHVLRDKDVESNFKLVSRSEGAKLIAAHWAKDVAKPQKPVQKPQA